MTTSLSLLLKQAGYQTATAASPAEALEWLERGGCELVLQDMNFSRQTSGEEGMELLREIKQRWVSVPVILMTAWGSIELAVQGIKAGAADFVTKPWTNKQILQAVKTALGLAAATPPTERTITREDLDRQGDFANIIGADPQLLKVLEVVSRVAPTDASVLITGESGTGKDEIAQALFRNSSRRDQPFVKVNLGGISSTLFDSEMFGHVKGAFTDARQDRAGRFELADGGTIFLDEIGDLAPSCQVKLLRVLQDRTYEVLGSSKTRSVDVRVISATNQNLLELVESGGFPRGLALPPQPHRSAPAAPAPTARGHPAASAPLRAGRGPSLPPRLGDRRRSPELVANPAVAGQHPPVEATGRTDRVDESRPRLGSRRLLRSLVDAARGRPERLGRPAHAGHHDPRRVGTVDDRPLHGALPRQYQPGGPSLGLEPSGAVSPL